MARKRSQRIQKIIESPVLLKQQGFFFTAFVTFYKRERELVHSLSLTLLLLVTQKKHSIQMESPNQSGNFEKCAFLMCLKLQTSFVNFCSQSMLKSYFKLNFILSKSSLFLFCERLVANFN